MPTQAVRRDALGLRRQGPPPTDQSRRREMVCNLLTQIFVQAERTRAAKQSARRQASIEDGDREYQAPISLIELIQASYTVFERYGIGPPDDAVYHRYLLSLSIDPERNWRKKIRNFDLGHQPRVRRLCRHTPQPDRRGSNASLTSPARHQRSSKISQIRRASLLSNPSPPKAISNAHQRGQQHYDRFGDMLSLDSPTEPMKSMRRRTSVAAPASPLPAEDSGPNLKIPASGMVPVPKASSIDESDDKNLVDESSSILSPHGLVAERSTSERQLQMITNSIEQWRATQAVKQLVEQSKQHEEQQRLALCIYAIFHWVTLSLPERIDFHATESPLTLPLCILRRISVSVNILKQSARHVWVWQMKTLLQAWHRDAQRVKALRVRMIVKQRAAVLDTAFQCFQRWRFFTETKKCSEDRAHWITQRCNRSRLRDSLWHWQQSLQIKQQQKNSDLFDIHRVSRKVLTLWHNIAVTKRDERRWYEMARKRRILRQWTCAKERSQTYRVLLNVSLNQRRLKLLSEVWTRMRAHTSRSLEEKARLNLYHTACHRRQQQRFFSQWKMAIDHRRAVHQKEERFHRYYRRRRLSQVFSAWSSWIERQMTLAETLSAAEAKRAMKLVSTYLKNWKTHFEAAANAEVCLVNQVTRLRRLRIWTQWRKRTGTTNATRRLGSAYCFHVIGNVFSEWKKYTKRRSELRTIVNECQHQHEYGVLTSHWKALVANVTMTQRKLLAAEKFRQHKQLQTERNCFVNWQEFAQKMKVYRRHGDRLKISVRRIGLMRIAWTSWRRSFWMKTAATLAVDQLYSHRKSKTFRVWKQFVIRAKMRQLRALKVVEMLGCFHLNACFRQWKELIASRHRLTKKSEILLEVNRVRVMESLWIVWRQALNMKRGQHEKLSAVTSRWQNRQLYASFHCWRATWVIRKRHRRLVQETLLTSKQRVLEIHFNAWKKRWNAVTVRERQYHEAQRRLLRFKIKRSLRRWNAVRLDQHKRSGLLVKSLVLWRQTLLATAFRCLLAYKHMRKHCKLQGHLARSNYRARSLQRCFFSWSAWRHCNLQIAMRLKAVAQNLNRLRMKRSVQKLKHNTQSRQQLRKTHRCAVAMSSGYTKIAGFTRWKAFIAYKQSKKRKSTARSGSMRDFQVRRMVSRWKTYANARKLMQRTLLRAAAVSISSRLQLHFKSWKTFIVQKAFSDALKKKATVFRHFCLLPMCFKAWRAFLIARNHRKELLRRARGLWCHQRESGAFRAWMQFAISCRQAKLAVGKWQNQATAKSFGSWKRFASLRKKKRRDQIRSTHFHDRRLCQKLLRDWSLNARRGRLSRQFVQMWQRNTSRQTFDTWVDHVRLLQSGRQVLVKMRNRTLARVFTAWKEQVEHKTKQLQEIRARFVLLWQMDTRTNKFARWKRFARVRSLVRRKLGGQRGNLLEAVIRGWRHVTDCHQRSRQCGLQVANRSRELLMHTSWTRWRVKTQTLRCVKMLQGKMMGNRITRDLRQRIHRWKQFTVRSLAVKEFHQRQCIKLARLVFVNGLQNFVALKRRERELTMQITNVHDAYLKEWLAARVQQRMAIIARCENIRQSGSTKRLVTDAWRAWKNFHAKKKVQKLAIRHLHGQISRLEEQDCPQLSTQLSSMLRRWQFVHAARAFECWLEATLTLRQARLHAITAISWWHKSQCKRYFLGWMRFCKQEGMNRRVHAMNIRSKLRRMWTHWSTFKFESHGKKTLNLRARHFHSKCMHRCTFRTWQAATTASKLHREQILELYHSSRLRLLAVLFSEWRKFSAMEKTKRTQMTIAHVVHDEKITRKCFTQWKMNVAGICYHRHQLQINTERLQVLLLCSAFRAWFSWSRQHRKLCNIMNTLSAKCGSSTASRVLMAWHLCAEKRAKLKHQTASFLRFRRLQKGIAALRNLTRQQRHLRIISQKAQLFRSSLAGNQTSDIFNRWKVFTSLSRKTRIVTLRYLRSKLLPAAWDAWVKYAHSRREQNEKCLAATLCWKNAFLRKAWNAVVLLHNVKQERRLEMARSMLHHRSYRLRRAVVEWRQWRKESHNFRTVCGKFISRWRMQTAYRCYCALSDHAVYHKTARAKQAIVRIKSRTSATLKAWYAWRKLLLVLRSGRRRLLQRYLVLWQRSIESRKILQDFQEQIQARVLLSTQRQCMANWKQFVATRKVEKAMVLMSAAFADTQVVKRTWLCWRKFVSQVRISKLRMKEALAHMKLQGQFRAFRSLQEYSQHRKWKLKANHRACVFQSKRIQARWLMEWKKAVAELIRRQQKLGHYLNLMKHALQHRSFTAWSSFIVRRKMLRLKVSESLALRSQMCSRMVFQTWKVFALKAQRNRKAHNFYAAKASACAINRWKQYVVLCKIERMLGASAMRRMEASFLSWRKTVAATHQIRAFRAKSTRKHWLKLVGMIFRTWQQHCRTQAHCKRLLASVAVGNHLRFRFMLWQRFTAHRKRLSELLLVAADPSSTLVVDLPENRNAESVVVADDETSLTSEGRESPGTSSLYDDQIRLTSEDQREIVTVGQGLAKNARILQRFEVTWDLPHAWHRWRQVFHAQLFYRMRRLQAHFICWQNYAYKNRRTRWIVIKLTNQRQAASALIVFRAWAELVTRVKQLQKDRLRERELWVLVTTEMARRERRQLKAHWRAWKFHLEDTRHLQSSLEAYRQARVLTKHWLVWCHDYHQVVLEARSKAENIEAHMHKYHLRRAVRALRTYQERRKRARLVLEYFGNRRYDTLLPEILSQWRHWCRRQREIRFCLAEAQIRKTRRHFTAWRLRKTTRKWQRRVVTSIVLKSSAQCQRNVWMQWRRYVKNRVVKSLALQKAAIFHVRSRLQHRWLRHAQRVVKLRARAEIAHLEMNVFRGRRAARRWKDYSHARRLRRLHHRFVLRKHVQLWHSAVQNALATRFDEFLLRSKMKKMLCMWRRVASQHHYWRQLCVSFMGKQETRTVRRVLFKWQQLVNARQIERAASIHAQQSTQRRFWQLWSHLTQTNKQRRREQYEEAVEHEERSVLRRGVRVWQAAVKKQRERRFVVLSCVVKLESLTEKRVQEIVFRAWKKVIQCERRCRVAFFKHECIAAKRAVSNWFAWIREKQQMRLKLDSAEKFRAQRLVSAVFFYWQTYALAWQDAAKPIARRHKRQLTLPAKTVVEPLRSDVDEGSEDSEEDVRRPTSPVMKRLRQKKASRMSTAEAATSDAVQTAEQTMTLPDAVEISMDVKKRLILLGKWNPRQKPKSLL